MLSEIESTKPLFLRSQGTKYTNILFTLLDGIISIR